MATVLRSNQRSPSRPVAYQLDELAIQARTYLEQVRAEAEALRASAKNDVERLKQEAHEHGLKEGRAVAVRLAQAEADARVKASLPALTAAVQAVQQAHHRWKADWEREAIRLAVAIASRVVRREISKAPDAAMPLVREALSTAVGGDAATMHLNPEDHTALSAAFPALVREFAAFTKIEFLADESIERGGCRLKTNHGIVDLTASSQLARIEEELCG